jgi:hypothetical protein
MFETYRMLGQQREAELQREADRLHALPPSKLWAAAKAYGRRRRRSEVRPSSPCPNPLHPVTKTEEGAPV